MLLLKPNWGFGSHLEVSCTSYSITLKRCKCYRNHFGEMSLLVFLESLYHFYVSVEITKLPPLAVFAQKLRQLAFVLS